MGATQELVAQSKTPQQALLNLAKTLDRIEDVMGEILARLEVAPADGWGEWSPAPELASIYGAGPELQRSYTVEERKDENIVEIKPVSEEKQMRRQNFAIEVLELYNQTQELSLDGDAAVDAYKKGGPQWLYFGNRELFMQYSYEVRAAMVADVHEDDPLTAQEMGRDVLVVEEGSGEAWTRNAGEKLGYVPE